MTHLVLAAATTPLSWMELCRGPVHHIFETPGGKMMRLTRERAELTATAMQMALTIDVRHMRLDFACFSRGHVTFDPMYSISLIDVDTYPHYLTYSRFNTYMTPMTTWACD